MKFRTAVSVLALVAVSAQVAFAHPHHVHAPGTEHGLAAGFFHPLLGLDHLLAMFAVGLLAAQLGGRALWALPAAFLGLMVAGGAAGLLGVSLPGIEVIIAASVLILGVALAVGRKYPLVAAAIIVGLFGLVHGHAHGTEMPAMTSPLVYGCGFFAATAALHVAGLLTGLTLVRGQRLVVVLRLSGAVISLAGLALLFRAF